MFGAPELFALQVKGRSMIDDHIAEGDYLVIRKQKTAHDGQVVVALSNDGAPVLKRFYRERNRVRLEPVNHGKTILAKQPQIMGVLIGVVRRYS